MAANIEKQEAPTISSEHVYQLGHAIFTIKNCDDRYKQDLEKLLPSLKGEPPESIEDIKTGCSRQIIDLIRQIVNLHHQRKCVWIEGVCLITPTGKKVLIAGMSQSGKSTTAVALALRDGWKILCENYCIIDYASNQILKFLSPAALDSNALTLLKNIGVVPTGIIPLEWRKDRVWAPLEDTVSELRIDPVFDFAFLMDRDAQSQQNFSHTQLSASEFGRKILALSNLLKIQGSYDALTQSLRQSSCHCLSGGELEERLQIIINTVSVRP